MPTRLPVRALFAAAQAQALTQAGEAAGLSNFDARSVAGNAVAGLRSGEVDDPPPVYVLAVIGRHLLTVTWTVNKATQERAAAAMASAWEEVCGE